MRTGLFAVTLLLLTACNTGFGQDSELRRKASLGVLLEEVTDSIVRAEGLGHNRGVYLSAVMEGGTAHSLGLREGDVVTQVNDVPVNAIAAMLDELTKYRAGDELKLTYSRNGKMHEASGEAKARPTEVSDKATVRYGAVKYKGNLLRTILHLPIGIEQPPVVFYIQGYTCQSIDLAFSPEHPVRKLIDDWVNAGYAVYRIEKPGIGDSESEKHCLDLNFNEEVEAFRHGYIDLKSTTEIDAKKIFLFGHSIGGIIAPVIASEFQPRGLITYGTVVNTWFEYMQELTRVQGVYFNRPDEEVETDIRNATPFWYAMLVEKQSNEAILENEVFRKLLADEGTLKSFQEGQFIQRHYTYWSGIQDIRLTEVWSEVESNVLALYGEFDIQALNADHIYAIERVVNHHHPNKAMAEVIAGADHSFVRFESMDHNVSTLNSGRFGQYMQQHYHDGIGFRSVEWMNGVMDQ